MIFIEWLCSWHHIWSVLVMLLVCGSALRMLEIKAQDIFSEGDVLTESLVRQPS